MISVQGAPRATAAMVLGREEIQAPQAQARPPGPASPAERDARLGPTRGPGPSDAPPRDGAEAGAGSAWRPLPAGRERP